MQASPEQRAFEVDRAWREHQPLQATVPFAAKQRAQALVDAVARDRTIHAIPQKVLRPVVSEWFHTTKIGGKKRALGKLQRLLAPSQVREDIDSLVILSLMAYGPNIDVRRGIHRRYAQDAISVLCSLLAERKVTSFLTLEAPLHALARMFERGPMSPAGARAALSQAADRFLAADCEAMRRASKAGSNIALPGGDGLFLGEVIELKLSDADTQPLRLFYRARTWIGLDNAMVNQTPPPAAMAARASVLHHDGVS